MSHFSVLVIGDDVERQLKPYDENTEVEPRRDDQSIDDVRNMLEHYAKTPPSPKSKAGHAIGREPNGYQIVIADGKVISPSHEVVRLLWQEWSGRELFRDDAGYYSFTRYNPQSKWDWYSVGGRWTGYFKAKVGVEAVIGEPGLMTPPAEKGWADQLRKQDIDIDGMRADAAEKAGKKWDAIHAVIDGHPVIESWDQVRLRFCGEDESYDRGQIDSARQFYNAQPAVVAVKKANLLGLFEDDDYLIATREEVVDTAIDSALSSFAVVKDGQWYEKGKMGWWGMVADEKVQAEWNKQFSDLFDALSDDTLLTIVDCHI